VTVLPVTSELRAAPQLRIPIEVPDTGSDRGDLRKDGPNTGPFSRAAMDPSAEWHGARGLRRTRDEVARQLAALERTLLIANYGSLFPFAGR